MGEAANQTFCRVSYGAPFWRLKPSQFFGQCEVSFVLVGGTRAVLHASLR